MGRAAGVAWERENAACAIETSSATAVCLEAATTLRQNGQAPQRLARDTGAPEGGHRSGRGPLWLVVAGRLPVVPLPRPVGGAANRDAAPASHEARAGRPHADCPVAALGGAPPSARRSCTGRSKKPREWAEQSHFPQPMHEPCWRV